MMDSTNFVFIPTWVKIVSFVIIMTILACSMIFVAYFISVEGRETWVLVGMSTAQIAGSGLVLFLVVAFSQRDATISGVRKQADAFLEKLLPRTLLNIETQEPIPTWYGEGRLFGAFVPRRRAPTQVRVQILHNPGEVGATYIIHAADSTLRVFAELNVWKMTLAYYIPAETDQEAKRLEDKLSFSFPSEGVDGFRTFSNYSRESFDGRMYLNMILQTTLHDDFLQSNLRKIYVANIIMTHTQSLIRNASRDGVRLSYDGPG
jgi:hypothetical protein